MTAVAIANLNRARAVLDAALDAFTGAPDDALGDAATLTDDATHAFTAAAALADAVAALHSVVLNRRYIPHHLSAAMITFAVATANLNHAQDAFTATTAAAHLAFDALHAAPYSHDLRAALKAAHDAHEIARAAYIAARTAFNEFIEPTP